MDYYIFVNGQKEGPFDILSFIKKVKNGTITGATQVSTTLEGPFRPASEVEELKSIIKSETRFRAANGEEVVINLNTIINEGTDTWLRKIIEYTVSFSLILVVAAIFYSGLKKIPFFADYLYVTNYLLSLLTFTLFGFFFYYVLMTKRSQDPDFNEVAVMMKITAAPLAGYAALVSLFTLPLGVNIGITILTLGVIIALLTFTILVPFLITDHNMGLKRSLMAARECCKKMNRRVIIVIASIVILNMAAGLIPVLLHSQIIMLGLVVTVPLSISILAQIYDRLLS